MVLARRQFRLKHIRTNCCFLRLLMSLCHSPIWLCGVFLSPPLFWLLFIVRTHRFHGIEIIDNELPTIADRYTILYVCDALLLLFINLLWCRSQWPVSVCLSDDRRALRISFHISIVQRVYGFVCLFICILRILITVVAPLTHSLRSFEYSRNKSLIYLFISFDAQCNIDRSCIAVDAF